MDTSRNDDIEAFTAFGRAALLEAGAVALAHFRRPLVIDDKDRGAGFDPVTEADRAVEARLRESISARFPEHAVTGEEHGADAPAEGWRWMIDPIDGTRAFITGVPLWGMLLGLLEHGRPRLGWMYQPYLGELFGGDGHHAWLERGDARRPLVVSRIERLADACVYTTHPEQFAEPGEFDRYARLAAHCRLNRYGGDCYSYCMLAAGHVDLVVESGLQAYDILPLVPVIEGAGGVVTDWAGRALDGGGQVIAAATPELHRAALAVLAGEHVG